MRDSLATCSPATSSQWTLGFGSTTIHSEKNEEEKEEEEKEEEEEEEEEEKGEEIIMIGILYCVLQ